MTVQTDQPLRLDAKLERKIGWSRWTLLLEQLWPRLWLAIGVAGLFMLFSLAGLWPRLDALSHKIVLGLFAVAFLAALLWAASVRLPSREAAIRRLERNSGVPHRPASAYADTLTETGQDDPATRALWQAHRERLARLLDRMKVGTPHPRADRKDPWALRALMMLGVVTLLAFAGDSASDRLRSAFRIGPPVTAAEARLDAWVTPPAYTAKPPIMLSDGARGGLLPVAENGKPLDVPERSQLIIRTSGTGLGRLSLVTRSEDGTTTRLEADAPKTADDAAEIKSELRKSGVMTVSVGGSEIATWAFNVIPDKPPTIALVEEPESSLRGSMTLRYTAEDDYALASAEVVLKKLPSGDGDPDTAWAREDLLKGPRFPLDRPPPLPLRLPAPNAKNNEAKTQLELGQHPWAGLRVVMTLEAKDHAGQVGASKPVEMILPMRLFRKPLARAVIEQRQMLVEDDRYRPRVLTALEALTTEPEGFITDTRAYLGLRNAYHRLKRDKTRAGMKDTIDQLWHVALRLEDGDLSDAERRLRELQEQLSKAIKDGASPEEIARLMQELRQALNEFLEQMMRQAQNQPPMQMPPGMDQNMQSLSQEDLERMMRQIEEMAKNGSRDAAQQMLSELRDLLDRLQSGRMAQGQQGQQGQMGQQMMQSMNELGNIIGQQQRLMDDTFSQQGQQGQDGQQGQQGQQGQRGQQGQGQGQQGQRGQQPGGRGLGQRQGQLGDALGQLQRQLRQFGMRAPEQFNGAEQAMRDAQRALENGDLDQATRDQSRALEQLRQGAQSMAQQMLQRMPSRFGQAGDVPRDPLGRPPRSENLDPGNSVRVPDAIDMQRAREILEELRRRLGEATRPQLELDYIERLLRRF